MPKDILFSRRFENGLELHCIDLSKKIAADRWTVCVSMQMPIPLQKQWFVNNPVDDQKLDQIRSYLGGEVLFEQKKVRNFISDDQKDRILEQICNSIQENMLPYLERDDFPGKYILKRFIVASQSRRQPPRF